MKDVTPPSPLAAALGVADFMPAPSLPVTIEATPVANGTMPNDAEVDYLKARSNLFVLDGKLSKAIDDVLNIAETTQELEAYNVLGGLIGKATALNRELVKLHALRKQNREEASSKDAAPNRVENRTIIATSEDIQKMIAAKGSTQ